jgi:hypothetical protein
MVVPHPSMLSNWAGFSTQPCFPANPLLTQRSFRFLGNWVSGQVDVLPRNRRLAICGLCKQIHLSGIPTTQQMRMSATSQKPTSGSLKLFWIGVDASRHGIMLGAFRRLDQGDVEIKGGASLAIRRVLLASQVALTVMPSPGSLSYQKPHSCYAP